MLLNPQQTLQNNNDFQFLLKLVKLIGKKTA